MTRLSKKEKESDFFLPKGRGVEGVLGRLFAGDPGGSTLFLPWEHPGLEMNPPVIVHSNPHTCRVVFLP